MSNKDAEREPISTINRFGVAVNRAGIILLLRPDQPMSEEEALQLAAWLVAICPGREGEFQDLLDRVMET